MALLKQKTKTSKYGFELDAEMVQRIRATLKRVDDIGDVELPINEEVQQFLVKYLDKVDQELDKLQREVPA